MAGDDLEFAGTAQTATQNDLTAGTSFHSIKFADGGFSITGNCFVLPNNTNITVDAGTATISANVSLGGRLNVYAQDATLSIAGVLSNNGSSTGNIKVWTGSTLVLSGQNTYTGSTTIAGGTLDVSGGDNRLSTSASISISGGVLDLGGHSQTTSGHLTFSGSTPGTVENGTLTFNGLDNAINAYSGSGIVNADLNMLCNTTDEFLTVGSNYTLTIGGSVNFANHNLYVRGGGSVTFDGTSYTGTQFGVVDDGVATFSSGNLTATAAVCAGCEIDENEYLYDTNGTINWESSGTLDPGALLAVGYGEADGVFTQSEGTVDATASGCVLAIGSSGSSSTTNVYYLNGGTLEVGSLVGYTADSLLSFGGGTFAPTSDFSIPSGSLLSYTLATGTTSTFATGSNDFTWDAVFSGGGGLMKTGSGTLTLTATNTYTGGTTVDDGTLVMDGASAVPGGADLTVNGTLDLCGHSLTVQDFAGSGVVTSSQTGAVTLAVAGDGQTIFSGILEDGSGQLALAKTGSGTLVLGGENDYSGGTTVSGGTLDAETTDALPGYDVQGEVTVGYRDHAGRLCHELVGRGDCRPADPRFLCLRQQLGS